MSRRDVQAMIHALVRRGYLRQEGLRYPTLVLTDEGREIMQNRVQAQLGSWKPPAKKSRKTAKNAYVPSGIYVEKNNGLREAIRNWRLQKARQLGVPPYALFWDRTLDELCARRPSTANDLLAIWGIGEQKRRAFGAEILALIAAVSPTAESGKKDALLSLGPSL